MEDLEVEGLKRGTHGCLWLLGTSIALVSRVTLFPSFPSSFVFIWLFAVFLAPFCAGAGLGLTEHGLRASPVAVER